jgi:hypothetical protein
MDTALVELDANKISLNENIDRLNTEIIQIIQQSNNCDVVYNEILIKKFNERDNFSKKLKEFNELEEASKVLAEQIKKKVSALCLKTEENPKNEKTYASAISPSSFSNKSWADEVDDEQNICLPISNDGFKRVLYKKKQSGQVQVPSSASSDVSSYNGKDDWVDYPTCSQCKKKHPGECITCKTCFKRHNPNLVCRFSSFKTKV